MCVRERKRCARKRKKLCVSACDKKMIVSLRGIMIKKREPDQQTDSKIERERETVRKRACVCVRERETERDCVRERKKERKKESGRAVCA